MKTSHTPGPWTVAADMRGLGNVPVAGVETSAGLAIANCGTHGEANASLIAAAPDLLAALQEILPHIIARPIVGAAILERARAAIARATN